MELETLAKLIKEDHIAGLESFISLIEGSDDVGSVVSEFLLLFPNCDDILQLLSKRRYTNNELATIFSSVGHILMSIANDLPEYESVGIHVARWVIQNQSEKLLSIVKLSNSVKCITSGLHCITGMIMTGCASAYDVITHLDIGQINFKALADRKDIRTRTLYLVLALLNTRDSKCVRPLLQVEGAVTSLFKGLEDDPCDRVIKFLNLLQEAVVLDMNISKTLKLRIFNASSCCHLLKFYRIPHTETEPQHSGKLEVKMCVHRLMMTLCTDYRHGIIFREKQDVNNVNKKGYNFHVLCILKSVECLWNEDEGKELISCSVKSCPDLLKTFMESFVRLEPNDNDSYFSLVQLFCLIIRKSEPWSAIENQPKETKGSFKEGNFLIPGVTSHTLTSLVGSSSALLIHCGVLLLNTLYKKIEETLSAVNEMQSLTNDDRRRYRDSILQIGGSLGGGISKIFQIWHRCLNDDIRKKLKCNALYRKNHPTNIKLLRLSTEVYYQYAILFGYNLIRARIVPIKMLERSLKLSDSIGESDLEYYQNMLCNILKILLLSQKSEHFESFGYSKDVQFQNESVILDKQWFMLLIDTYSCKSSWYRKYPDKIICYRDIQASCLELLEASLTCWGLSSYCHNNFNIWLNKLSSKNDSCTAFLAEVIINSVSNLFVYLDALVNMKALSDETSCKQRVDMLTEVDSFSKSLIKDNQDIKGSEMSIPFSCLVVGAVEILTVKPDEESINYFSEVMSDYLHYLENPKCLASYLLNSGVISHDAMLYINAVINIEPIDVQLLNVHDPVGQMKVIFMSGRYPSASEFFSEFQSQLRTEADQISLCRQVILYLKISRDSDKPCKKKAFRFYLKVLRKLIGLQCEESSAYAGLLQCLLEHPFIIESYRPYTGCDNIHCQVEHIILKVLTLYPGLQFLLRPYIEKLLHMLQTISSKDVENIDFVSPFVVYTSNSHVLTCRDIESLINLSLTLQNCDTVNQFLLKLLEVLPSYGDSGRFSLQTQLQLFARLLILSKEANGTYYEVITTLSETLATITDVSFASALNQDDLKQLVSGSVFPSSLCCRLIKLQPSLAPVITKQLKKSSLNLEVCAPYIVMHIDLDSSEKHLRLYLSKIKDELMQWAYNPKGENSCIYMKLFDNMLRENIFGPDEISSLCNYWYEEIVPLANKPPVHIMCISPAFKLASEIASSCNHSPARKVQLLSICLAKVSKCYGKDAEQNVILEVCNEILALVASNEGAAIKEELKSRKLWSSFVKQVLKKSISDMEAGPQLITCLIRLIEIIYVEPQSEVTVTLSAIHEMLRSHSEFLSLMLSQEDSFSILKEKVVQLLQVLVERNSEGCEEKHVPLLLAAYGASRSSCDQAVLKLLFWYERNGFMKTYTPTIWGKRALSYFSVEKGPGIYEHYTPPHQHDILNLLDEEKVYETALNFHMHLGLEPLVVCESDSSIYDQRFLMMIFLRMSEEEPSTNIMDMIRKGGIAIGIAALSSHCREVWAAGATILKNIVAHLEQSGYQHFKLQWMWLIAVLGYGFEGQLSRLASVLVHFLIKTSQLLFTPEDIMYKAVLNYVYLKPALPIFQIPEFYSLFFSDDNEYHKEQRSFLLNLLASGIRDGLDIKLCQKSFVLKLIVGLLTSPTADIHLKVSALKVIKSAVSVPDGAALLVQEYSILAQLPVVLDTMSFHSNRNGELLLMTVLDVLVALWTTLKEEVKKLRQGKANNSLNSSTNNIGNKRTEPDSTIDDDESKRPIKKAKIMEGSVARSRRQKNNKNNAHCWRYSIFIEFVSCLNNISGKVFSDGGHKCVSQFTNLHSEISTYINQCKTELEKNNSINTWNLLDINESISSSPS